MQVSRITSIFGSVLTALVLSNCAGYHVGAVKPDKMKDVASLSIPTFKNMTLTPRASVLVTNAVIRQTQIDGSYKVAASNKADAVLKGTIKEVRRRPLRTARFNSLKTREMEVELILDYTIEDARTNAVLADGTARGSSHIFLDQNFQLSERQAVEDAAKDLADDLVSKISEGIPGQSSVGAGGGRSLSDRVNL